TRPAPFDLGLRKRDLTRDGCPLRSKDDRRATGPIRGSKLPSGPAELQSGLRKATRPSRLDQLRRLAGRKHRPGTAMQRYLVQLMRLSSRLLRTKPYRPVLL